MEENNTYTDEQIEEMKEAMRKHAELFYMTFGTEPGMKVLEHLKKLSNQSSLQGNDFGDANVSVSASEFMFIREGQDQVIRYLDRMVQYYKENR